MFFKANGRKKNKHRKIDLFTRSQLYPIGEWGKNVVIFTLKHSSLRHSANKKSYFSFW